MEWLNYHHLFYFWSVVRAGTITKACEDLRLAPPTISAQLRELERQMGEKLLARSGRTLVPTEVGRMVFRYADEIFGLGRELLDAVRQRPTGRPLRLVIGVDDVLPKEIAYHLIQPALHLQENVQFLCREAGLDRLVAELMLHELDVVLSDSPITASLNIRAYSHPLGDCGVVFMGTTEMARSYRARFPRSLDGAPVLLPTDDTAIRRNLDMWFSQNDVHPKMVGEFEDYALLRVFGNAGTGVFPVPSILERQFRDEYGVCRIGSVKGVKGRFYAVTVERKIQHPAVVAICESARKVLFA